MKICFNGIFQLYIYMQNNKYNQNETLKSILNAFEFLHRKIIM